MRLGLNFQVFDKKDFHTYYLIVLGIVVTANVYDTVVTWLLGNPWEEINPFIVGLWYSGYSWSAAVLTWGTFGIILGIVTSWLGWKIGTLGKEKRGNVARGLGMFWLMIVLMTESGGHLAGGTSWILHALGFL